jgi:hypothetical protein
MASKIIKSFNLDLSDIPAAGESRAFSIVGDPGSEFKLVIKDNTTGYYYNFVTNRMQVAASSFEKRMPSDSYTGNITFPAVTGTDDQYDIYLHAKPGTKHADYAEARFGDGSLDINNSRGSSSLMMQKVVYQYAALTLTLQGYSIGGAVAGTMATDTISIDREKNKDITAFSMTCTAGATAAYRILKQPVNMDVLAFIEPVVGAAPIDLPGENIYPAISDTDTIDGAVTSGAKVVMDNNVATNLVVGDKITTAVTTDTVNGAVTSGIKVIMDNTAAAKMAVGDQITGNAYLDANIVTVVALDPDGDNDLEFSMSEAVAIADGVTLTFSSELNRNLTTVLALNPDGDNVKEFSMSQSIQLRDGATLSFSNQKNYRWPLDDINKLGEDMIIVADTNVTANSVISKYQDTVTLFADTDQEEIIIKYETLILDTLAQKPTIVNGLVSVQPGAVTFDKQQVLALAGDTLKIGGYGANEILRLYGWEVRFSNLAITLTAPTTTTTEVSAGGSSADIAVTDREGVINNVSRVGGIGINPALQNPLITSGGGADGAGDWTMDAVQTLENGITLTVENTGRVATITGNIEIIKAGTASQTLRFDVNKLLSTSAP